MLNYDHDSVESNNLLFGFFKLGTNVAKLCKENLMYTDYNDKNLLYDSDGNIILCDLDDMKNINFPKEIKTYAKSIMNLYTDVGMEFGAAFRFGFITSMGKIGEILYDILYYENNLTFLETSKSTKEYNINYDKIIKTYTKWKNLIENSFIKKHTHGYEYEDYYFFDIMEKYYEEYKNFKKQFKNDMDLMRHEYNTYFANSLHSGNDFDLLASIITLCQIEFHRGKYIMASYYFFMIQELKKHYADNLLLKHYEFEIGIVDTLFLEKFGTEKTVNILQNITQITLSLRMRNLSYYAINRYLELWYWSDYERENNIDNLTLKKEYSFFLCKKCGHFNLFETLRSTCITCNSNDIIKITRKKFFELLEEKTSKSDKTYHIPKLPEPKSVEDLVEYIQIINTDIHNNEYSRAIELSKKVEKYINTNNKIKDENGYVIIKSSLAGNIFIDNDMPNILIKLFRISSDSVKSDYETYIYFKLCDLYDITNDIENSMKYANKIINIANNSKRWIQNRFYIFACEKIRDYYNKEHKFKEALEYTNIIFTLQLIDEFSEEKDEKIIKEHITNFIELGEQNLSVGNIFLAYRCYLFALTQHIFLYGIRHPNRAKIYLKIAELYAKIKQYDNAFSCYALAITLIRKESYGKKTELKEAIENSLHNCLLISNYKGSLADWEKDWLNDKVYNFFPEERFIKDNHTINLTNEGWKNLVMYIE